MIVFALAVVLFAILMAVAVFLLTYSYYNRPWAHTISYIALPPHAIKAVVEALELKDGAVLIDLGCGDGRVLAAALKSRHNIQCIGVEHNPLVRMLAWFRLRDPKHCRLIGGDLMKSDLSQATHLFTYLNDALMAKLEPKLERELRPGTRVVSCDFPLPNRHPTTTLPIGQKWQLGQTLYIYEF